MALKSDTLGINASPVTRRLCGVEANHFPPQPQFPHLHKRSNERADLIAMLWGFNWISPLKLLMQNVTHFVCSLNDSCLQAIQRTEQLDHGKWGWEGGEGCETEEAARAGASSRPGLFFRCLGSHWRVWSSGVSWHHLSRMSSSSKAWNAFPASRFPELNPFPEGRCYLALISRLQRLMGAKKCWFESSEGCPDLAGESSCFIFLRQTSLLN